MATGIPCAPFGKKMKVAVVEQDTPQQELARRLGTANSTVSNIIYDRNRCERTKERIVETLGIEGQETTSAEPTVNITVTTDLVVALK